MLFRSPASEPIVAVEPEPTPADLQPLSEPAHKPEFSVVPEPEPLLEFVVEPASDPGPVTVPIPESQPLAAEAAEPLPDFIVRPGSTPERPPPAPAPEPEPEPDLGPLPDYIVDPSKPPAPKPEAPERRAAAPTPKPFSEVAAEPASDAPPVYSAGLNFPPATTFPTPREDADADEARENDTPKSPRRRPARDAGKSKRGKSEAAEPGDEAEEVSWMQGLSNRLSAYSLSEEEAGPGDEPGEDEPEDAETAG